MRTKRAAMLRKARYQKHYYNTLKIAAEMDEQEASGLPPEKGWNAPFALLSALIFGTIAKFGIDRLWNKYGPKSVYTWSAAMPFLSNDEFGGGTLEYDFKVVKPHFSKHIFSFFFVMYLMATIVVINKMSYERKELGMGWVEFIKYLFNRGKGKIEATVDAVIKRPTPKGEALVAQAIKPDGSLNKAVLKRYVENNV